MSALFRKIQKAEFEYPKWFSPEVKALLGRILVPNPEDRLTIADIERDAWYCAGGPPLTVSPFHTTPVTEPVPVPEEKATVAGGSGTGESTVRHVPSVKDMEEAVTEGVAEEKLPVSKVSCQFCPPWAALRVDSRVPVCSVCV
jgi:serine/threonine protein kinase